MQAMKWLSLFLAMMLVGCASKPTVVASVCPPPPPIPLVLQPTDALTGSNLMQRYGSILKEKQEALNELSDSLSRAQR